MFTFRDFIVFLAGAQFFHTLSHILLPLFIQLPLDLKFMIFTPALNIWAIVINAVITVALLWWAKRLAVK